MPNTLYYRDAWTHRPTSQPHSHQLSPNLGALSLGILPLDSHNPTPSGPCLDKFPGPSIFPDLPVCLSDKLSPPFPPRAAATQVRWMPVSRRTCLP